MIPVLGIPVLSGPELLAECIASIDYPVGKLVVIDNSPEGLMADVALHAPECVQSVHVTEPPSNLGVAASWNFIIRTSPHADWWAIANADTVFGPGDLQALSFEMRKPGAKWVGMCGDWRVMGLNREAVEAVGFYDENFHPIYLEDCDYEYRCSLAGVPWYFLDGTSRHVGSHAIREPRYATRNAKTYPANVAYFREKWGGLQRGGESYLSPWNRGGPVSEWSLDVLRLRELSWT